MKVKLDLQPSLHATLPQIKSVRHNLLLDNQSFCVLHAVGILTTDCSGASHLFEFLA